MDHGQAMRSGLSFGEVRFSHLGHGLVRLSLCAHKFVRFPFLGMDGLGSQGINSGRTISLKAWNWGGTISL